MYIGFSDIKAHKKCTCAMYVPYNGILYLYRTYFFNLKLDWLP